MLKYLTICCVLWLNASVIEAALTINAEWNNPQTGVREAHPIALAGDTVIFSMDALTAQELADGWKYSWLQNGSVIAGETAQSVTLTMSVGGVQIIRGEFHDASGTLKDWGEVNYSVVDVSTPTAPSQVFLDVNEKHTATCTATGGVPTGGTYTWSKSSGSGTVTFTPNGTVSASTTTATFSETGTYRLRVTYTVNPDAIKDTGDIEVKKGSFGADPVYVVKGKTRDVTFTLPTGVTWTEVTFDTSDSTKATTTKPATGNNITVNGIDTANYNIRLRAMKGSDYVGFSKVVVVEVTGVSVQAADTMTKEITSVQQGGMKHFVTPKGVGTVMLEASVAPDTTPVREKISWQASGQGGQVATNSPAVGTDNRTVSFSRGATDRIEVTCKIDGQDAWKGRAWVIWATVSSPSEIPIVVEYFGTFTRISGGYNFTHTISPQSMFTEDDRPNLGGTSGINPPNVPSSDITVAYHGVILSGGAPRKWDSSRQMKLKLVNPNSVNFQDYQPADLFVTHPVHPDYPSDSVCGNDDQLAGVEDNNPDDAPVGQLTEYDKPIMDMWRSLGNPGDTVQWRLHFREFTRVELNGTWYRISDFFLWKMHFKWKKIDEAIVNADYDGDGNKTAQLWIDDGTVNALNNNDF